ncbi:RDD family protein [Ensifer canadensis]
MFVLPWTSSFFISATIICEPAAPSAFAQRIDREWPLAPGQSRENQICTTSLWGVPDSRSFVSTVIDAGDMPGQRSIRFEIDEAGNPVELEAMQVGRGVLDELVPILLFCLTGAALLARFGTTPGKRLFALRVVQDNGEPPPFAKTAKREALRMLPTILAAFSAPLLLLSLSIFGTGDILRDAINAVTIFGAPVQVILLVGGLLSPLLAIVWWVWPFIRWRGQTIYDRLTGCRVIYSPKSRTSHSTPAAE